MGWQTKPNRDIGSPNVGNKAGEISSLEVLSALNCTNIRGGYGLLNEGAYIRKNLFIFLFFPHSLHQMSQKNKL